ncbi:hypothetical protein TNCV_2537571 [Trichonephila clavipes]|nr:hypothetical protein TNCV_2537571 [Trichonephila clavipes]
MAVENKVLLNTTVLRPIMTYACPVSTDSMAGEAVSLHSLLAIRNCKIYRQNFEADDFPSGAVNLFKGGRANSRGFFTPSSSARKTLHSREAHLLPEVTPFVALSSHSR